jgi:uncharacterized protein
MLEKIKNDLKGALRNQDTLRLSTLRMLISSIHNREIEKKSKGEEMLSDEEIVVVVRSELKKRRDAADGFAKGGRREAAEKEQAEAKILESYLPAELSDEEVLGVVKEVVAGMGEVTMKEFGKVMGEAMKRLGGQAGGDLVKGAVRKFSKKQKRRGACC